MTAPDSVALSCPTCGATTCHARIKPGRGAPPWGRRVRCPECGEALSLVRNVNGRHWFVVPGPLKPIDPTLIRGRKFSR